MVNTWVEVIKKYKENTGFYKDASNTNMIATTNFDFEKFPVVTCPS